MTAFPFESLVDGYPGLIDHVVAHGRRIESRVGLAYEVSPGDLMLLDPLRCMVDRPKFSRDLVTVEALGILAGAYHQELTSHVSRRAGELQSHGTAYGPRTTRQMGHVLDELRDDPSSRRAVAHIARHDDLEVTRRGDAMAMANKGEMPCTVSWQFLIRGGRLDMHVHMRSWDAVWGLCYDVPCFVAVQRELARLLGVDMGLYHHRAASLHVYHATRPKIDRESPVDPVQGVLPELLGEHPVGPNDDWGTVALVAHERLVAMWEEVRP